MTKVEMEREKSVPLNNNPIELFILKIDLNILDKNLVDFLIENINKFFERKEAQLLTNYKFIVDPQNTENNKVEVDNKEENMDYLLINDAKQMTLKFSIINKFIYFQSKKYIDYHTYNEVFEEIINLLRERDDIHSKRIGMRFINKIFCEKQSQIKSVLKSNYANTITNSLKNDNISRLIYLEELNLNQIKAKVQMGLPNRYYPSLLKDFEIVLDIDVFSDYLQTVDNWNLILKDLNKISYETFLNYLTPKFIESLK